MVKTGSIIGKIPTIFDLSRQARSPVLNQALFVIAARQLTKCTMPLVFAPHAYATALHPVFCRYFYPVESTHFKLSSNLFLLQSDFVYHIANGL